MNPNKNIFFARRRALRFFLRFVVLLVVFLSGAEKGFAVEKTDQSPFRIRHWTTENGLPQDRISCLQQTRDGYLWIGTWFGLVRFDGVKFTVFKEENKRENIPGLRTECINDLTEDKEGTLWIATKQGIISNRNGKFQNLRGPAQIIDQKVWRVRPAKTGGIWFSTDDSVTRYKNGTFSSFALPHNAGAALNMLESDDGSLNVFYRNSWFKVSPDGTRMETNRINLADERLQRPVVRGGDGDAFWLGTKEGLKRYENSLLQPSVFQMLATNEINFLYGDSDQSLWAGVGRKGLFHYDGTKATLVDLLTTGMRPLVNCMERDHEGSIWVGTERGLFQLQRSVVRIYSGNDGLHSDNVSSVCEDRDGTIWAAADYGEMIIRNGTVELVNEIETGTRRRGRCVWPKREGGIWMSKEPGLVFASLDDHFSSPIATNLFSDSLYEDRSGRLWVGGRLGAFAFEANRFDRPVISTAENGVKEVCSILEDRNSTIWLGTKREGLVALRDGKYSRFTKLNGLSDDQIWNIYEDASGALWIGTGNGLTRYRDGKFFAFTVTHGLREEPINCVLEDDYGYIWLSGLKGIYRIKREDLEAVASGRKSTFQSITLGTEDGMENAETNGERQPAGWKARDGRLWFPTIQGLAVIDPKLVDQHHELPRVLIEGVKADDKVVFDNATVFDDPANVQSSSPVNIAAGSGRVLEFTYTANTFSKPEKTSFRYRLTGADAAWHEQTRERTVRYLNLRPGKYQFEVIAANRHGQWNERPAIFAFSLKPQLWQTWPFYAAGLAVLLGMISGIHFYRLRWQRRLLKLDELRALANERARIARDLHDDLGTALAGLALELDVAGAGETRAQPTTDRFAVAAKHARGLAQRMREVVWAINPRCDNSTSLSDFLEEQITYFLSNAGIRVRLNFPENIPTIPIDAETRHQMALCVREALNNIVRHARASLVNVRLHFSNGIIHLSIKDDGCGFDQNQPDGNGLSNIRVRLEKINGTFECISIPGEGSELRFAVPMSKNFNPSERKNK